MKTAVLLPMLLVCTAATKAQQGNPFAAIGKKEKVYTLSNGRYDEVDENGTKRFLRMGSVIYDSKLRKVVEVLDSSKMVKVKTTDSKEAERWFQIDPHADSYTSWSPYTFAKDNPIIYVDPDGMDDYRLNKDGQIQLIKTTDNKTDRLYALNSKGAVDTKNSLSVGKGILNNIQSGEGQGDGKTMTYNYMEVSGTKAGDIFKFAADNSNVEWSLTVNGEGKDIVSTSHSATGDISTKELLKTIDVSDIKEMDHSHPGGIHEPSGLVPIGETPNRGGDVQFAVGVEQRNPAIKMNIYTPSDHQFTPYSSKSRQPDLAPVIVRPRKHTTTDSIRN